ncbi:hypothetical protein Tco_0349788 [Tanacetum coccineum]
MGFRPHLHIHHHHLFHHHYYHHLGVQPKSRHSGYHPLRIASTQALIDAVTIALLSPLLPPLPSSLYISLPIDRRDNIPESEHPPHKRLCLSTLGSRYEIGESSTTRPIGGRGGRSAESVLDEAPRPMLQDSRVSVITSESYGLIAGHIHMGICMTLQENYDLERSRVTSTPRAGKARQPGPDARIPDHHDASGDADSHI